MTAIGSLLALAAGVVLVPFSLDTKVFTILALVFVVLFVGLFSPSIINSWLLAARPGIAGVVAIWLVVWLLYVRRTRRSLSSPAGRDPTAPVTPGADTGDSSEPATDQPATPEAQPDDQERTDDEVGGDKTATTDSPGQTKASDDAPVADEPEDVTGKPEGGSDEQ
jgi:hypothetical protein